MTEYSVLVIFGGTGDLFKRKLAPSLFTLFENGSLPEKTLIIGVGRSDYTRVEYQRFVQDSIEDMLGVIPPPAFLSRFAYAHGEVHEVDLYERITTEVYKFSPDMTTPPRIMWYCSISPHLYADIAKGIYTYTQFLKQSDTSQNMLLLEKPIGHDSKTCEALNTEVEQYFTDSQVIRIEHYLTKETLVRTPQFFAEHPEIAKMVSGEHITRIEVDFWETIGVEKRGAFYDSVGAFRDVGQNHMLEMLAIVCADYEKFTPKEHREARTALLKELAETVSWENSKARAFQYEGYKTINGVDPDSSVETAFSVQSCMPVTGWNGIPFTLKGGKRMGRKLKRILLHVQGAEISGKQVHAVEFSIDPEQVVVSYADTTQDTLQFRPGHTPTYQYVEEYARILDAAFNASDVYSVNHNEVELLWNIADVFTELLAKQGAPYTYAPDTSPFEG